MAESKKALKTWEHEKSQMVHGDVDEEQRLTEADFIELSGEQGFSGVDVDARTKFLKDNGYDLTRENYLDYSLTAKQAEEGEGSAE